MEELKKEYSNGAITIVWKPASCIHSALCVKGLPGVFKPKEKPWIQLDAASTNSLIEQVKKCPSGALSYYSNEEGPQAQTNPQVKVNVMKNGPLVITGTLAITSEQGEDLKENTTAFCRCGASNQKPYCDGSHQKVDFQG